MRAAKEKATALTREIGQAIGKAHSISEEDERSASMSNNSMIVSGNYSASEGSTIAPGMIKVSARVTVSFELH